ncbi:unnamed protein product [Urochloa humidicola]
MAATATATSVMFLEPSSKERKPVSLHLQVREVASTAKEDDDEEMRRLLFERFMASYGPGTPCLRDAPKVHTQPCVLYTMRISVKKARVSWSHRSSRRFLPERRGNTFPIPICRVVAPDQVEQVLDRSGAPGEPARPGIVSGIFEGAYYAIEHYREKRVIQKEGSPALLREVAVIRGMPRGCGITVTSHVKHLVVRLHDILFLLPGPSATVDLCFSEHSFRLPSGWKEERLYSEDGFHFVDIGAPVESLLGKLDMMRRQEDQEIQRRMHETEEERERRLLEEEVMRKQEELERRTISERNEEMRRRQVEEEAAKPAVYADRIWDAALWEMNAWQTTKAHCYSKFELIMNSSKQVSCKCVEQVSLHEMLRRVREEDEFVLPILAPAPLSASSKAFETVGFVEGYFDLETIGQGMKRGRFMDQSGRTIGSVLMVSRSTAKVLTIKVVIDKLDILLDDGMVLSCGYGSSVDIHCDDVSSYEILTANWRHHILCKNIGCEGITSFSSLLVQLKKKLDLKLSKEELGLYIICAVDDEDENKELTRPQKPKRKESFRDKPNCELAEVELRDYNLLFQP